MIPPIAASAQVGLSRCQRKRRGRTEPSTGGQDL